MEYINQIKRIIADKTGVEPNEINEESYFEDDLNVGELELVEILGDLEEILEIEGLLEKKDDVETFGDLVDILSDHIE